MSVYAGRPPGAMVCEAVDKGRTDNGRRSIL